MALTLTLTLALTLALTLTLATRVRAALTLPLTLTLPLPLPLALALTLALRLLSLALAAGICQLTTRVLQPCGSLGEIPVGGYVGLRARQRLAEAIERGPRPFGVALGEALGGIAQCSRGRPVRAGRGRLHLGQLSSQLATFRVGHLIELVGQLLEILLGLLGIAVAVRVGVAGRRPRQ